MTKKIIKKSRREVHEVTDELRKRVRTYRSCGLTIDQICIILNIARDTLYRKYKEDLDVGLLECIALVAQKGIIQPALKGNVSAAIFYLKCQARWKEKDEAEQVAPVINVFSAPVEQQEKIEDWVIKKAKALEEKRIAKEREKENNE